MNDKIELYLTHCIRLTVQMFTVEQSTLSTYGHQTKPVCVGTLNTCSVHFKPIGILFFVSFISLILAKIYRNSGKDVQYVPHVAYSNTIWIGAVM